MGRAAIKAFAGMWAGATRSLFDTYRPELHYMRGPGPKWREKHIGQFHDSNFNTSIITIA